MRLIKVWHWPFDLLSYWVMLLIKCLYGMFPSNVCMECSYQLSVWNVLIKHLHGMFLSNGCMECFYQTSAWNVPIKRLYGMFLSNVCKECSYQTSVWNVLVKNGCMECFHQTSVWNVLIKRLHGMFPLNVCMECSYQASVWNVPVKRLYGMFLSHVFWHISYSMHYFHGCKNSGHTAWPSQQLVHFFYKYTTISTWIWDLVLSPIQKEFVILALIWEFDWIFDSFS